MSEFKVYKRKGSIEARPYVDGEILASKVSVSEADRQLSTLIGGMIARNPDNHDDQWYINEAFFKKNYEA